MLNCLGDMHDLSDLYDLISYDALCFALLCVVRPEDLCLVLIEASLKPGLLTFLVISSIFISSSKSSGRYFVVVRIWDLALITG